MRFIIMQKQKLEELKSAYYQKGLERGFKQGQIYQAAEAKNKGCILSLEVKGQVEQILKDSEDAKD